MLTKVANKLLRVALERWSRGWIVRRRLPGRFGSRPIWVTPDARLRFLKWGEAAFDQALLGYGESFTRPGDTVWDIGANVGEFAIAAAHRVGEKGRVLAVEADPMLAGLLQRSLCEVQNRDLRADLLCAAVADHSGIGHFRIAARGRAANALAGVEASTQMGGARLHALVALVTLDLLLAEFGPPVVVKIDVEGAEGLVLQGATTLLTEARPVLIIEVSGGNRAAVSAQLQQADYALFDATTETMVEEIPLCVFNTLAVPREKLKSSP
jgi:FkbM family methyltransferase